MSSMVSPKDLSAGQPKKNRSSKQDDMDNKAFRVGFQLATLMAEKEQFEREKAEAQSQLQLAMQQMLAQQAQQAAPAPGMIPPPEGEGAMMPPMGY